MRTLGLVLLCASGALGAGCPETPAFYEGQGYLVRQVRVDSILPLGRPATPALAGQPYRVPAWLDGQRALAATSTNRGLRLVLAAIGDCDERARTLTIVYRWFSLPRLTDLMRLPERLKPTSLVARRTIPVIQPGGCRTTGPAYPLYSHTGPNYTASSAVQFGGCGLLGWRNTVRLHAPAVTSSYAVYPGRAVQHEFDTSGSYSLGSLNLDGRIQANRPGGRYAAQFSAAVPVWRRRLIPKEVVEDGTLAQALQTALAASESALTDSYLAETREFQRIATDLMTVREILRNLPVLPPRSVAGRRLQQALKKLEALPADSVRPAQVRGLAVDFVEPGSDLPPVKAVLTELTASLARLERRMPELAEPNGRLERLLYDVETRFRKLEVSTEGAAAELRARSEVGESRQLLTRLVEKTNLYAASPVFLMTATDRLPLAVGAGARVTLLAVDVTLGYCWTVRHRPGAPKGALSASFDLTHLFR
ncbi:MAG: hypothetical protein JNN08_32065 [Bryobacterales bacterium]|nr:hypothetical protein [Bryobacterales bacterium]